MRKEGEETVTWLPVNLRCEYVVNPVAMDEKEPRLSWELQSSLRGQRQSAYRIIVASTESLANQGIGDCWDTGEVESDHTIQIVYEGKPLQSFTTYYWKVWSWSAAGFVGESRETARWTTGILEAADWQASWIEAPAELSAPLFRHAFRLPADGRAQTIRHAALYIASLGFYELYLNGRRVGDQVLSPVWSDCDDRSIRDTLYPFDNQTQKRAYYMGFDVRHLLLRGDNAIGVMLGNGFYRQTERTVEGRMTYGIPKLRVQLVVDYDDNRREIVGSSCDWQYAPGPIRYNNLFYGEQYDARKEQPGWSRPSFSAADWKRALPARPPTGNLSGQLCPPDRVVDRRAPKEAFAMDKQRFICDFGQNLTGWLRIVAEGERGSVIRMRFAENRDAHGELDFTSCGGEEQIQQDLYILSGNGQETYEPRFVWHGFRYAEVAVLEGACAVLDAQAAVVHADVSGASYFRCSEPRLNRLFTASRWSIAGNLHLGFPSDCPHRERLGYTGDGHVAAEAAAHLFDLPAFYTKWMQDVADAQNPLSGFVPHTAPYNGGGGGVGWGSAIVIMPWLMYRMYGDVRALRRHYAAMKRWLAYLAGRNDGDSAIVRYEEPGSWFLGDWCVPGENELPPEFVSTYFYGLCARLLAHIADLLGEPEDGERYRGLYREIGDALNEAFLDRNELRYCGGKQGAELFPLALGCVPEHLEASLGRKVIAHYRSAGHVDTGIFGTDLLWKFLGRSGELNTALDLVLRPEYPGYGYWLERGATTLWEHWDGRESHNHPMFASVVSWLYQSVAGISTHPEATAYRKAILRPCCSGRIRRISAGLATIRGMYRLDWEHDLQETGDVEARLTIGIPPNCSADVFIPLSGEFAWRLIEEGDAKRIAWKEGNEMAFVSDADDGFGAKVRDDQLVLALASGDYAFRLSGFMKVKKATATR
ncbi:family 78 glycoside hydrolase catalytic domain [Paenibacillaceae bacterium WGS1546]|uniref:family 78 glycoside hydrolase catalytic domain n=1 Tax=Cohnella sp. WGS1546 TaxID=3366810 RepID=UPI00372D6F09